MKQNKIPGVLGGMGHEATIDRPLAGWYGGWTRACRRRGAEVLIAGCTEIPLMIEPDDFAIPLLSSTDIMARHTVDNALGHRTLPRN